MSWTDKELDDMAKAAQAEQKFVYQDAFWAEAEAMLPAKKKFGFPFFALALIPLLGTLAYLGTAPLNTTSIEQAAKRMDAKTSELIALQSFSMLSNKNKTNSNTNKEANNTTGETITSAESSISNRGQSFPNATRKSSSTPKTEEKNITFAETNTSAKNAARMRKYGLNLVTVGTLATDEPEIRMEDTPLTSDKSILEMRTPKPLETKRWMNIDELQPNALTAFAFDPTVSLLPVRFNRNRKYWNGYIEGGFGMGQSYMQSQVGHTTAFSFGGGARYNFSSYFLQMGLGGEFQKARLELSEREKIYHTGSTIVERDFSYRQLYRIEAPITLGYQLKNHLFQLSVIPAFLTGAKMIYSQREDGVMTDNGTSYANKEGWKTFSTSFGVGYGYQVFKTVSIGANLKWQLMNQINKNMVSEGNVRPFSGQVFIRKTIH
jgi:hypothetical protein